MEFKHILDHTVFKSGTNLYDFRQLLLLLLLLLQFLSVSVHLRIFMSSVIKYVPTIGLYFFVPFARRNTKSNTWLENLNFDLLLALIHVSL